MPDIIGQHIAGISSAFPSPQNNDPLNADVVRGNDNAVRGEYVAHDTDPGIHLQSSTLATRPSASTAGRKWMTTDAGDVRVWHDTGTAWEEIDYVRVGAAINMADEELTRPIIKDYGERQTRPTISSGTLTLNLENGNVFLVALNANITTLTISNPTPSGGGSPATYAACSFTLAFTADGTPRTVTWPASVKWSSGVAPVLTSNNTKVDIFTFVTWDAGTTWYGFISGQNF